MDSCHVSAAEEWEVLFTLYVTFSCFAVLNARNLDCAPAMLIHESGPARKRTRHVPEFVLFRQLISRGEVSTT